MDTITITGKIPNLLPDDVTAGLADQLCEIEALLVRADAENQALQKENAAIQTIAESFAEKRNAIGKELSYLREAAIEFFSAFDAEGGIGRYYTDRERKAERTLRALLTND